MSRVAVDGICLRAHALRIEVDQGVDLGIQALDLADVFVCQLLRRNLLGSKVSQQFNCGLPREW